MHYITHSTVTALELDEIQFQNDLESLKPLVGVGVSRGGLRVSGSSALLFSGFNYSGTVTTVQLRLTVDRQARIQDKTIDLWLGDRALGQNLAVLASENVAEYTWQNLDLVWNSSLGVIIDLQPHTQYPSSNTLRIRKVELAFNQ